jgi:hypothetical protein
MIMPAICSSPTRHRFVVGSAACLLLLFSIAAEAAIGAARHRHNHAHHADRVLRSSPTDNAPTAVTIGEGQPVGCGFGGICHGGR